MALIDSHRPAPLAEAQEYERKKALNTTISRRHGAAACLTPLQFDRLANLALVRFTTRRSRVAGRERDVVTRYFHAEDVLGLANRRAVNRLNATEAAAMAPSIDIKLIVSTYVANGLTMMDAAEELARAGFRTETGAAWTRRNLASALWKLRHVGGALLALMMPAGGHLEAA